MVHNRRARLLARAVHELDDFRRQARFEQNLHERMARVRYVFGGLEHARVSTDEGGKHLPRRNRHREIERRDDAGDADGAAEAHGPLVSQLTWHRVAEETTTLSGRVVSRIDAFLHVAARLGERLSHLARHEIRDLVLSRRHEVAHAAEDEIADLMT